jgi:multidrug resistance efflux pump
MTVLHRLQALKQELQQQAASSAAALQEAHAASDQQISSRMTVATAGLVPAADLQEAAAAQAVAEAQLSAAVRERDALQQQVSWWKKGRGWVVELSLSGGAHARWLPPSCVQSTECQEHLCWLLPWAMCRS